MIHARRLMAVGAVLAVAAVLTCSDVWSDPGPDKELKAYHKGDGKNIKPGEDRTHFAEDLERNRFLDAPVVVYQAEKGEMLFGLQVTAKLPDAPARPKDYLVIIDTSASKAMGPLVVAQQIAAAL